MGYSAGKMATVTKASQMLKVSQLARIAQQTSLRTLCSEASTPGKYVSAATPADPAEPVGPGAGKTTESPNPECYLYNNYNYFDYEVEMKKDRVEQPSAQNQYL